MSAIARKTNCKVKILRKRGGPFLLNRYKKRKLFAIFLILILALIFTSSRYVWNVYISIKDNLELENISEDIENLGITRGIPKNRIDTEKVINELRLQRDDIAWVGLDIVGTSVKISIVKADKSPDIIKNTDYCNIVAKKAGTIQKITAQNGTAVVNVGDTVQKGDILIAGYMEGKYTDTRYVHSLGEVDAIILYEKSKEVRFNQDIYHYTGNEENKYEISFNTWKIKLYKNFSKFNLYEITTEEKNIKLLDNFYLPISIKKITNKEQTKENKTYSIEEAVDIGEKELSPEIEKEIENKDMIIDKNVKKEEYKNSVIVTVIYSVLENIGENQKIE